MKERNELARALTDLPDALLLEAERPPLTGKVIKFHRFVAAAAIIALLAVTAYAASVGITWNVVPEQEKSRATRTPTTKMTMVFWTLKSWNTKFRWEW